MRPNLGWTELHELQDFWESMQGPWEAFTYNVPNPDGTTSSVLVTFEQTPISFQYLRNACQVGLNLIEVVDPTQAPTYPVNSVCLRFPSTALSAALLSEVQEIVPLIHIRVPEATVPDIWLSDRRVTLTDAASGAVAAALGWAASSQLYLPRLTGIGEPGSDTLISQDIKGSSDSVRFTFGNADRTMTDLANDTDLKYAEIDFCAYHVNSGILIQIWKGVIQNYTSDGTPNFPVMCSDGFFQIMNQYPERQASRQCWKTYNDGVYCLWAAKGASAAAVTAAGGDPTSCDYYLETPNGCQVHGMAPFFGGQQADPQGVIVKDDSTGFLGIGRNTVTATSIITEYIWGLALRQRLHPRRHHAHVHRSTDRRDGRPGDPDLVLVNQLKPMGGEMSEDTGRQARLAQIAQIAVALEAATGCPAPMMIAQWAVESRWGAKPCGNTNYFGIKANCSDPKSCVVETEEVVNGNPVEEELAFADYGSLYASAADYAALITTGDPYKAAWVQYQKDHDLDELIKAVATKYASDPGYRTLVTIIANQQNVTRAIAAARQKRPNA